MHWNNIKVKSIKYDYLVFILKKTNNLKMIINIIPSFHIIYLEPFQLPIHP